MASHDDVAIEYVRKVIERLPDHMRKHGFPGPNLLAIIAAHGVALSHVLELVESRRESGDAE